MKTLLNLICTLAIATTAFAANEWQNYSTPFPVKAAIPYAAGMLMATDGGVRYRTDTEDYLFTTSNGLGDQTISAVVSSELGVYSISDNGLIAKNLPDGSWDVISRAYAGSSVRLIPGLARAAGSVMVLAFEDRLAFFSLNSSTSILTVEKIRDKRLSASGISTMEIQGDSLFVAIDSSLYVREMDWEKLESDVRLNDPDSWSLVKNASGKDLIKTIAWKKDTLKTFATEGMHIWDDDGETSVVSDTFSVFSSSAPLVKIRGKSIKDSILYQKDSVTHKVGDSVVVDRYYYHTRFKWVALLPSKKAILAGPKLIFYYDGKKFTNLTWNSKFPLGSAYELQALPKGGVMAASEDGYFSRFSGTGWSDPIPALFGMGNLTDSRAHDMKVLSVNSDGHMFYHVWGMDYILYKDWGEEIQEQFLASGGHCLSSYLDNVPYSIAVSTTPAPDGNGFLTTSASNNGYSLVYVDLEGNMSCADSIGSAPIAGPMLARVDETSGNWIVYIGTRSGPTLTAEGGLDVVSVPPPRSTGGELSSKLTKSDVKHYYGTSSTPLDLVYEPKSEYVWLVTESSLAYWNAEQDSLRSPLSTNGFMGADFTSIDADSRGNLWVGTSSQGAYRFTPRETSPDTLSVLHFSTRQGLLSDRIQDLAVDSVLGLVWFAHENGVSSYYRNDLRGTDGNMTDDASSDVKVYPNPFRPDRHPFIYFDNISTDAVINIFNRGGKLVKSLRGDLISGGRTEWDGRMDNGNLVAPGVYQYVIRGASKVKKGKLLVIH